MATDDIAKQRNIYIDGRRKAKLN